MRTGVPRDFAVYLATIFHPAREGWTAVVTNAVQTLRGHAPQTLRTYDDHAADFAAPDALPRHAGDDAGFDWTRLAQVRERGLAS